VRHAWAKLGGRNLRTARGATPTTTTATATTTRTTTSEQLKGQHLGKKGSENSKNGQTVHCVLHGWRGIFYDTKVACSSMLTALTVIAHVANMNQCVVRN
jgi:hypothetical protein